MKMEQSVPKRRHIKFRRRGITQKEEYNILNAAKIWNLEQNIQLLSLTSQTNWHIIHTAVKIQISRIEWNDWQCWLFADGNKSCRCV